MPRFRGFRRACLLVSSALHLLADVPITEQDATTRHQNSVPGSLEWVEVEQDNQNDEDTYEAVGAAQRILEDESLTRLPDLTAWTDHGDFGFHYNVVIPFRPPPNARLPPPSEAQRPVTSVLNQTQQSATPPDNPTANSSDNTEVSATIDKESLVDDKRDESAVVSELVPSDRQTSGVTKAAIGDGNATLTEEGAEQEKATATTTSKTVDVEDKEEEVEDEAVKSVKFDYASKSAGALILEKSAGWKGASNLLNNDNDRYPIIPCAETSKSVVISLSEDILVKNVVLANYERFSSTVKDFQLFGSQTMGKWVDLGTYTAKQGGGKQEFELYEHSWARYLKVRVLSHYGDEHYLTISQISVFGDTMLQGFHEHWDEEEKDQESHSESDNDAVVDPNFAESAAPESEGTVSSETIGEDGSANAIEISEFTRNDPCTVDTEVDFTCPKDLSFEQLVFLISANQSHLERMSFLDSTSSCRSLSKYEHSGFPGITVHPMSPLTAIATETMEEPSDEEKVFPPTHEDSTVTIDMTDSPVISQIQNLIKSTAGIDVDLSKINGLFQGHDAHGVAKEEGAASGTAAEHEGPEAGEKRMVPNAEAANGQPKDSVSNHHESKDNARSTIDAEEWSLLLKALELVPSSACLKDIDFSEFRKRVASSKHGAAGTGSSHSANGGMELQPIFKRLTDEIKTLQGTLGMQEDFLKNAVSCYQRVLLEFVVQQEESRSRTEQRLEKLEHVLETYLMWLRFVEDCVSAVTMLVLSVLSKPWYSWLSHQLEHVSDSVVILLIAITVLVTSRTVLFSGWRLIRRRFPSRSDKSIRRKGKEPGENEIKLSMPKDE